MTLDLIFIFLFHVISIFFIFINKIYIQNYSSTIRSTSLVKIANITLYNNLIIILKKYNNNSSIIQLRLIDDIFGVWAGPAEELMEWVNFLNTSHNSIK